MVWKPEHFNCIESQKIRWEIVPYTRGAVLDIGVGPVKPFSHFTGIDNNVDARLFGRPCKPDVLVEDATKLSLFASQSWDSVFSSHLLEHVVDWQGAIREWWRVVKVGGYMVLYLPHKDFYPNIGEQGSNPDHKHDFLPSDIICEMEKVSGWNLLECQERNQDDEYSFLLVFQKLGHKVTRYGYQDQIFQKKAAVTRYGAFGDLLQASSVIKGLKDQGFHVTLYTSPPGSDVITHDPNIDRIILQDKDQVPNAELGSFWAYTQKKYDRWVNLSESVEGTLLALPGRSYHGFSPAVRHKLMNLNYLELQHDMAAVPHKPQVRFYPTKDEASDAERFRGKIRGPVVMWALAGSGVHKTWPYVDNVIASMLLKYPRLNFVLVGDAFCKMLESGWENESRVYRTSGDWSIRKTLAFARLADCVVGPETGVMNAVSCENVPKVVFLSHSTHFNLTRDWINAYPMWAENVNCKGRGNNEAPACHQLHYGWDHCTKDSDPDCERCKDQTCTEHTATAVCQKMISPEKVIDALVSIINRMES